MPQSHIQNFDKTHHQHLKVLKEKAKAQSVMPDNSFTNSPACIICELWWIVVFVRFLILESNTSVFKLFVLVKNISINSYFKL